MQRILTAPLIFLFVLLIGTRCQENAMKNLSPSLIECYDGELYKTYNQLPHTMDTLIGLIRKIEAYSSHNTDLLNMRHLSTALLHRFRQDGILRNPKVRERKGVLPYAPLGKEFFRHKETLRVIPATTFNFPNESLNALERCTLHYMLSTSIDRYSRGDESRTCKYANYAYRRFGRSVNNQRNLKDDVETLSPEQIEMIKGSDSGPDPSSLYPALPPNHPASARLINDPPTFSKCPSESGVVRTEWGSISGGALIAGIAAGLEPQMIRIDELIKPDIEPRISGYATDTTLDNKFLATLAGDLAEVALKQGPQLSQGAHYSLGAEGSWNSTARSLYYFLGTNENLEMTGAEIRGGLDGLILGTKLSAYSERARGFRLSQALDMYFSERGLFDRDVRACKRRDHLLAVAPTATLAAQTFSAVIVLSPEIATATFTSDVAQDFATRAADELKSHVATMSHDNNCDAGSPPSNRLINDPAVDLTIVLDTTWPYESMYHIISQILSRIKVDPYYSNVTLMNASDGSFIINSTNLILDFFSYNSSSYDKLSKVGPDLPKAFTQLRQLQIEKLNREQRQGKAGGMSDVVIFMMYVNNINERDKNYCNETLKIMKEEAPDATILFLANNAKDPWTDLVVNPYTDIISINAGNEYTESYPALDILIPRIKQVPRRLVNTQCGAEYDKINAPSRFLEETVFPGGINFYRLHPNYFFGADSDHEPKVKIQNLDATELLVCSSRMLMHENTTESPAKCTNVRRGSSHEIVLDCDGRDYISDCEPFYMSVAATNSTNTVGFSCTSKLCKYPDSIRFTISYENLVCTSGQRALFASPLILLLLVIAKLF